ncbi:MAG TPA: response regulator transcription factor [Cyclobacteriaceae bacterium]|nr:response regulator transcription factor [Cyclobacteriaceae bacterium]
MSNTTKNRILAIDDEPSVLMIIQHFFKEKFEVVVKDNAEDGIKLMQTGYLPDIIICDLTMPNIDGLELVRMIRSSGFFSSIPLIMLSATESSEQKIAVLNAGADDFMVKPFNPKELEARINSILRRTGKNSFQY